MDTDKKDEDKKPIREEANNKIVNSVINLPICQNYVEIGFYGQDSGPNRVKDGDHVCNQSTINANNI
jgi:hypothetical protein